MPVTSSYILTRSYCFNYAAMAETVQVIFAWELEELKKVGCIRTTAHADREVVRRAPAAPGVRA